MSEVLRAPSAATVRTALLVIGPGRQPRLCPFFAKCDGVLLIDSSQGSSEFYRWDLHDGTPVSNFLLRLKPARLICGFIDEATKRRLRAAGIDIRLGSCSCSIAELVAQFSHLPRA